MTLLDSHVHVWDPATIDYPWLAEAAIMPTSCGPTDTDDADGAVSGVIVVEADAAPADALAEARWLAGLDWPKRRGIVAAARLDDPRLGEHLDALADLDGVVGVRHLLQDLNADDWPTGALATGLAELARRGLTFDACVRHEHLPALAALLERVPDAAVVLDHLGKPPVDAGLTSPVGQAWASAIERLARLPRLHVKLSGLAAESADPARYASHAPEFVTAGVAAFGTSRAMIGSDWPVSARAGVGTTLTDWLALAEAAVSPTPVEAEQLRSGTAQAFYLDLA